MKINRGEQRKLMEPKEIKYIQRLIEKSKGTDSNSRYRDGEKKIDQSEIQICQRKEIYRGTQRDNRYREGQRYIVKQREITDIQKGDRERDNRGQVDIVTEIEERY